MTRPLSALRLLIGMWVVGGFTGYIASANSMTGENDDYGSDIASAHLAYFPPRVHHTYGCVDMGIWNGSCDIDLQMPNTDTLEAPAIVSVTDWSERCDPWKGVTETMTTVYKEEDGVWVDSEDEDTVKTPWAAGNWTCPEDQRSMSGCGDFRTDTRHLSAQCTDNTSLFECGRPYDRRIFNADDVPNMRFVQRHACIQHPIFYDNYNTPADHVIPPAVGRHRERWAKWGEYDFLPPQRWLHNLEHGGLIFLYHQCLDEESLCALRRYIQKWQARIGAIPWQYNGMDVEDKFRFILTPFKDLANPMAIVSWGHVYSSKCFNEHDMDYFIEKWYRSAYEDWSPSGPYDYLWKDIDETAASCGDLPDAGDVASTQFLTAEKTEVQELRALVKDLTEQVTQLQTAIHNIKDVCIEDASGGRLLSSGNDPCLPFSVMAVSHAHSVHVCGVVAPVLAACLLLAHLTM